MGMDQVSVFPMPGLFAIFLSQVWSCLSCVRFRQRSEISKVTKPRYVMICMTVMICYDHRKFSTFWVILFSQTFQHHFKNTLVNLDVSFPASKEWTRRTDAVGKLWPGSSGKSAFVQSVFFRLSKWNPCGNMPIISHSSTWKNVAIYPLLLIISIYIYIYVYPIVTQDFTVHTLAREFIGTFCGSLFNMSRFVQSGRGARFHSRPPGAWAGEERFLGPTKRRTTGATPSFWRFQLPPTVWHVSPRKKTNKSIFTDTVDGNRSCTSR